jgi:RNA polymerase sigma-70 factor (ECF subfamily)
MFLLIFQGKSETIPLASNHSYSEKELLLKVAEGDEDAFTRLFYAYKGKLFSFILDLTLSEAKAEDILQDVFLKIWQARGELGKVENFNAYIFRAAQNRAIDQLRKFSRETLLLRDFSRQGIDPSGRPDEAMLYRQMQQRIGEAVDHLPLKQKQVYLLHKEEGLPHDEIAQKMGLSVSTVQNHMFRAVGNIRAYLGQYYADVPLYVILILGTSMATL